VVEEDFTNIIDLAFAPDGSLYVLEYANQGITNPASTGELIHVATDGTRTSVSTDLLQPGSVVVDDDGAVYVSNCGSCAAGEGEILRWPAAGG
jgi:DNA-binding beta-propeller fold protein YncE